MQAELERGGSGVAVGQRRGGDPNATPNGAATVGNRARTPRIQASTSGTFDGALGPSRGRSAARASARRPAAAVRIWTVAFERSVAAIQRLQVPNASSPASWVEHDDDRENERLGPGRCPFERRKRVEEGQSARDLLPTDEPAPPLQQVRRHKGSRRLGRGDRRCAQIASAARAIRTPGSAAARRPVRGGPPRSGPASPARWPARHGCTPGCGGVGAAAARWSSGGLGRAPSRASTARASRRTASARDAPPSPPTRERPPRRSSPDRRAPPRRRRCCSSGTRPAAGASPWPRPGATRRSPPDAVPDGGAPSPSSSPPGDAPESAPQWPPPAAPPRRCRPGATHRSRGATRPPRALPRSGGLSRTGSSATNSRPSPALRPFETESG